MRLEDSPALGPGEKGIKKAWALCCIWTRLKQTDTILTAVSVRMDCRWRLHSLLSAMDFSDESKRKNNFPGHSLNKLPSLLMPVMQTLTYRVFLWSYSAIFFHGYHCIWWSELSAVRLEENSFCLDLLDFSHMSIAVMKNVQIHC